MNAWYFRRQLRSVISGAEGLPCNLPLSELKDLVVVVPPVVEAERIVEVINRQSEEIAVTIAQARREIILMQEYRTALIAEAVTGRIDVRS